MFADSRKLKWLLNFSSSSTGGGLKRLEETAKWFDEQEGAVFVVNSLVFDYVSRYERHNHYISIKQNKIKRFIADGRYLPGVIDEIGVPDIYFSYGIPVFYEVGRVNWFHVSNALTLVDGVFDRSFIRRIEHRVLGRRIITSMKHVNIASAESEFSLNLLKNSKRKKTDRCSYLILENGCEDTLFHLINAQPRCGTETYAITVGTAPYKRIALAHKVFKLLQMRDPDLKTFRIIGNKKLIPKDVINDNAVDAIGSGFTNEKLYDILRGSKYYISASQIENSSNAAIEGLLLAQNVVLSGIPSHREICQNLLVDEIKIPDNEAFILVDGAKNKSFIKPSSWNDVLCKMTDTAWRYINSLK